jgi:hypothetical protein
MQLKDYITRLQWSAWLLGQVSAVHSIFDFWAANGSVGSDLLKILSLLRPSNTIARWGKRKPQLQLRDLGEADILPLLRTLFPDIGQLEAFTIINTTEVASSLSPMIRSYLTHLVLSGVDVNSLQPKASLDMLDRYPELFEAARLALTMFAEVGGLQADLTSYILFRVRPPQREPNWAIMVFLLEELDMGSVITILQEAQSWSSQSSDHMYPICKQFLIPGAAALSKCITGTNLCSVLATRWKTSSPETMFLLQSLCETYTLPPKDLYTYRHDSLVKSAEYPRTDEARSELAQSCLLRAIRIVAPWLDDTDQHGVSADEELESLVLIVSAQLLLSSKDL